MTPSILPSSHHLVASSLNLASLFILRASLTHRLNMSVILQVSSLVKRFGQLTAVNDVSFEIREGSCFGLLGRMAPVRPPPSK